MIKHKNNFHLYSLIILLIVVIPSTISFPFFQCLSPSSYIQSLAREDIDLFALQKRQQAIIQILDRIEKKEKKAFYELLQLLRLPMGKYALDMYLSDLSDKKLTAFIKVLNDHRIQNSSKSQNSMIEAFLNDQFELIQQYLLITDSFEKELFLFFLNQLTFSPKQPVLLRPEEIMTMPNKEEAREKTQEVLSLGGKVNIVIIIGGTSIRVGAIADRYNLGEFKTLHWSPTGDPKETQKNILNTFNAFIQQTMDWLNISDKQVGKIAISFAGKVDSDKGRVIASRIEGFTPESLTDDDLAKGGFPIIDAMRSYYPNIHFEVKSDRQSAVFGETFYSHIKGNMPSTEQIEEEYALDTLGRFIIGIPNKKTGKFDYVYRASKDDRIPPIQKNEYYASHLLTGPGIVHRLIPLLEKRLGKTGTEEWLGLNEWASPVSLKDIEATVEMTYADPERPNAVVKDKLLVLSILQQIDRKLREKDSLAIEFSTEIATDIGKFFKIFLNKYPKGYFIATIMGTGLGPGFYLLENPQQDSIISLVGGFIENFWLPENDKTNDVFLDIIQKEAGSDLITRSAFTATREVEIFRTPLEHYTLGSIDGNTITLQGNGRNFLKKAFNIISREKDIPLTVNDDTFLFEKGTSYSSDLTKSIDAYRVKNKRKLLLAQLNQLVNDDDPLVAKTAYALQNLWNSMFAQPKEIINTTQTQVSNVKNGHPLLSNLKYSSLTDAFLAYITRQEFLSHMAQQETIPNEMEQKIKKKVTAVNNDMDQLNQQLKRVGISPVDDYRFFQICRSIREINPNFDITYVHTIFENYKKSLPKLTANDLFNDTVPQEITAKLLTGIVKDPEKVIAQLQEKGFLSKKTKRLTKKFRELNDSNDFSLDYPFNENKSKLYEKLQYVLGNSLIHEFPTKSHIIREDVPSIPSYEWIPMASSSLSNYPFILEMFKQGSYSMDNVAIYEDGHSADHTSTIYLTPKLYGDLTHKQLINLYLLLENRKEEIISQITGVSTGIYEEVLQSIRVLGEIKNTSISEQGGKEKSFIDFEAANLPYPPGIAISEVFLKKFLVDDPSKALRERKSVLDYDKIAPYLPIIQYLLKQVWGEHADDFRYTVRSNPKRSMPGILDSSQPEKFNKGLWTLSQQINTVLASWFTEKAYAFRKENHLTDTYDAPIIIQKWGGANLNMSQEERNAWQQSSSAIFSTHDPDTGEDTLYGRYIDNQAGSSLMTEGKAGINIAKLKTANPAIYKEIMRAKKILQEKFGASEVECAFVSYIDATGTPVNKISFTQRRELKFSRQGELAYIKRLYDEGTVNKFKYVALMTKLQEKEAKRTVYKVTSDYAMQPDAVSRFSTSGAMQGPIYWNVDQLPKDREKPIILAIHSGNRDQMLATLFEYKNCAVITFEGNNSSHEAVLCRTSGIPSLIDLKDTQTHLAYEAIVGGTKNYPPEEQYIELPGGKQIKEGQPLLIDGARKALGIIRDNKTVIEPDTIFVDASFGISIPNYQKDILAAFINPDGSLKSTTSAQIILNNYREAHNEYLRYSDAHNDREAFKANLRKHFFHNVIRNYFSYMLQYDLFLDDPHSMISVDNFLEEIEDIDKLIKLIIKFDYDLSQPKVIQLVRKAFINLTTEGSPLSIDSITLQKTIQQAA